MFYTTFVRCQPSYINWEVWSAVMGHCITVYITLLLSLYPPLPLQYLNPILSSALLPTAFPPLTIVVISSPLFCSLLASLTPSIFSSSPVLLYPKSFFSNILIPSNQAYHQISSSFITTSYSSLYFYFHSCFIVI